jgi:hypothetical protein
MKIGMIAKEERESIESMREANKRNKLIKVGENVCIEIHA